MSLRLRVALLSAIVTGLVLTGGGVALVDVVEREARSELDDRLREDFQDASTRATVRVTLQNLRDETIDPNTSTVQIFFTGRVFAQGELLAASEDVPDLVVDPARRGFTTVDDERGRTWRVLTRRTDIPIERFADEGPLTIQVMLPTEETEQTISEVRRTAQRLGVIGIVVAAGAAWVLAWAALRPLRRLEGQAEQVSTTRDLDRRVPEGGPRETRSLARSLNAMLSRLGRASAEREAALETARSFAADVGHEVRAPLTSMATDLDVLTRNPDLSIPEQEEILGDMQGQHGRIVHLLNELGLLARGDLGEAAGTDLIDLGELVASSVDAARRHHPEVVWTVATDVSRASPMPDETAVADPNALELQGSTEGLRVLVANLLDNAATHGRSRTDGASTVGVQVRQDGDQAIIEISDDGPGVPTDAESLFGRFQRGRGAQGDGSGLGLAIVRQQAERHQGEVTLERLSPDGGARATVRLPLAPRTRATTRAASEERSPIS